MVSGTVQSHAHVSPIGSLVTQLESIFESSAEVINSVGGLILVGVTLVSILHTLQYFINELIGSEKAQKFWIGKG